MNPIKDNKGSIYGWTFVMNVFEHDVRVCDDQLNYLEILFRAFANRPKVVEKIWNQIAMAGWQIVEVLFGSDQSLQRVYPEEFAQPVSNTMPVLINPIIYTIPIDTTNIII